MRYQGRGNRQLVKLQKRGRKVEESRIFFARGQGEEEEEKETLPTSSLFLFFSSLTTAKKRRGKRSGREKRRKRKRDVFAFFFWNVKPLTSSFQSGCMPHCVRSTQPDATYRTGQKRALFRPAKKRQFSLHELVSPCLTD